MCYVYCQKSARKNTIIIVFAHDFFLFEFVLYVLNLHYVFVCTVKRIEQLVKLKMRYIRNKVVIIIKSY